MPRPDSIEARANIIEKLMSVVEATVPTNDSIGDATVTCLLHIATELNAIANALETPEHLYLLKTVFYFGASSLREQVAHQQGAGWGVQAIVPLDERNANGQTMYAVTYRRYQ